MERGGGMEGGRKKEKLRKKDEDIEKTCFRTDKSEVCV